MVAAVALADGGEVSGSQAVAYLREPQEHWIAVESSVGEDRWVRSNYRDAAGASVASFETRWEDPARARSEYGWGISLVHDVKDHIFYGLNFTPLTEIQTIVQTYCGRVLSGGGTGKVEGGDYVTAILRHVYAELFAPQGRPLVYSADGQTGLVDAEVPGADDATRRRIMVQMFDLVKRVMLPPIEALYRRNAHARALQASIRDQAALVRALLGGIVWSDREALTLRLADNYGFQRSLRAYVRPELAQITCEIREAIATTVEQYGLLEFGAIFRYEDYLLPCLRSEGA
ncbi:MAG: hypothetical protein AAF721_12650 [Myxococcota bacterium]